MPVMLIMHVSMRMFSVFVRMSVLMPLTDMQPHADGHQDRSQPKGAGDGLSKHTDRQRHTHKRSG